MDNRYSRKDIERILSQGTVKQKARLFLRDRMGYYGQGFILSYRLIEELSLSVIGPIQRKQWEEYISFGLRIENGFRDLTRFLNRLKEQKNSLRRTILELMDFEKYEVIINKLLLSHDYGEEVPNREDLTESLFKTTQISSKDFVLTSPHITEGGSLSLGLTGKNSLTERAKEEKGLVLEQMTYYLCYEEAMRRRIEELKLDIPEYTNVLQENRHDVEFPISMSVRFVGVQDNRAFQIGECNLKDREPKEFPYPSSREMIEDYSVRVQDIDLTTDECQKQIKRYYDSI